MTTKKTTAKRSPANTTETKDAVPQETVTTSEQSPVEVPSTIVAKDHAVSVAEPAVTQPTPAAKPLGPQGVRPGKTAPYHAGTVIKKHGMQAGVTPEMCQELCGILGHDDPTAEKSVLAWAWHVLNGYHAEVVPS